MTSITTDFTEADVKNNIAASSKNKEAALLRSAISCYGPCLPAVQMCRWNWRGSAGLCWAEAWSMPLRALCHGDPAENLLSVLQRWSERTQKVTLFTPGHMWAWKLTWTLSSSPSPVSMLQPQIPLFSYMVQSLYCSLRSLPQEYLKQTVTEELPSTATN